MPRLATIPPGRGMPQRHGSRRVGLIGHRKRCRRPEHCYPPDPPQAMGSRSLRMGSTPVLGQESFATRRRDGNRPWQPPRNSASLQPKLQPSPRPKRTNRVRAKASWPGPTGDFPCRSQAPQLDYQARPSACRRRMRARVVHQGDLCPPAPLDPTEKGRPQIRCRWPRRARGCWVRQRLGLVLACPFPVAPRAPCQSTTQVVLNPIGMLVFAATVTALRCPGI
jgi:hypothetical protein